MGGSSNGLGAIAENLAGREKRSQNLSTKLTEAEARFIEDAALKAGKSPSEWAREILLSALRRDGSDEIQAHIFTELIALELAIMNGLAPLLRGEKLSPDQTTQLFRDVQATKAKRAREILAKRAQPDERQP